MSESPNAVVFSGKIYIFHNQAGWLWMNVFDGTNWAGNTQVSNTGLSATPSAVSFNSKLYVFHKGQGDGWLWMNVFDGTKWAGDMSAPNTGLSDGPGAIVW